MNLAEERTAVEQSKETGDDEREKRRAQIFGIFLNIIIRRKERERECGAIKATCTIFSGSWLEMVKTRKQKLRVSWLAVDGVGVRLIL